jgi:alpha/beta superfamily hydrolase
MQLEPETSITREQLSIPGPRGGLAAELAYPSGWLRCAWLLVNPHPHMGGTMTNNLIAHLGHALAGDAITVRFDYSGIGRSAGAPVDVAASMSQFWATGRAPEDAPMVDDARAALQWLRRTVGLPIVVCGYSFGAFVATEIVENDSQDAGVVLISPTLRQHDLPRMHELFIPSLVIYSDNDFATPAATTEAWVGEFAPSCLLESRCVRGAQHFYRQREPEVADLCREFAERVVGAEMMSHA